MNDTGSTCKSRSRVDKKDELPFKSQGAFMLARCCAQFDCMISNLDPRSFGGQATVLPTISRLSGRRGGACY